MTSTVDMSGVGNPPMLPPNPGDIPTASRRGHGRVVAIVVVVSVAVATLLGFGAWYGLRAFGGAVIQGFTDYGEHDAAAWSLSADGAAKAHHIWDGALTLSLLNQQYLDVKWLPGDESVPVSGQKTPETYVSISVGGDHVVTAAMVLFCSYGLTVSASNDPIIREDRLSGLGTYWTLQGAPQPASLCSADSAPNIGWERADRSELKSITNPASS